MQKRIYWNDGWKFKETYENQMRETAYQDDAWEDVRLPHTCKETPFHYFDESSYQMVCCYRKHFFALEEWKDQTVIVTFEGIAHEAQVFLNGERIGEHHCGYTAFSIDISKKLRIGAENVLTVRVDSRENLNIPPFGYVIDYMTYGGIYREAYVDLKNETYLADIFLHSEIPEGQKPDAKLISEIEIKNSGKTDEKKEFLIRQSIRERGTENYRQIGESRVASDRKLFFPVPDVKLWDLENPVLYEVKTELLQNGNVLDENITLFGFRTAVFLQDGFYLNGKKVKLRGLNRHQSYPYVGYAMPESMQKRDADILKNELGVNAVRTSHYPQSRHFVERCDELGLLVFTEIPGWQHIGDDNWKDAACEMLQEMLLQNRSHPSIILWGVRINESVDDDAFYTRTNKIAHQLDPSRATSGVRYLEKSHLLEDVYAYNDFSHNGTTPGAKPKKDVTPDMGKALLISECNGHMYPTKPFDDGPHRQEHALRHVRVQNAAYASGEHAGCFGWCMFDYQTHKDFGSGDRICYHGVLDSFRNPKLAAAVYASQGDADPVLAVSSSMDIGDNPAGQLGTAYVFSNAQQVRLYKNDVFVTALRQSEWTALPHPPFVMDDTIGELLETQEHFSPAKAAAVRDCLLAAGKYGLPGLPLAYKIKFGWCMLRYKMAFKDGVALYEKYVGNWGGEATRWRFDAVQDGNVVRSVTLCPSAKLHLEVKVSRTTLREQDTYDMAAVRVRILDENGTPAPYAQFPVQFAVEGSAALVGPQTAVAEGGMTGTYLRTVGTAGEAVLTVSAPQTQPVVLRFTIEKEDAVWN